MTLTILFIIAFLIATFAEINVAIAFFKYKRVPNSKNITGRDLVEWFNNEYGTDIRVKVSNSWLGDYYDPIKDEINLSPDVANKATILSLAVAAHELGHALQKHQGYQLLYIRNAIVPAVNIGSHLGYLLLIVGLILNAFNLVLLGLILFSLTFVFTVITLPIEFNASWRAFGMLKRYALASDSELSGVKKVLIAAALTYVAAMLVALLNLLRFALMVYGMRSRD